MIEGVLVHPLKQIPDERGKVAHMLKATDPHFEQFGEIYFSFVYPGVVKGWHRHSRMTINYAVPVGMIKLVLYDDRPNSSTRGQVEELCIGESSYCLVKVPPMVWNGFKGACFFGFAGSAGDWKICPCRKCNYRCFLTERPPLLQNWPLRGEMSKWFISMATCRSSRMRPRTWPVFACSRPN